MAHMAVWGSCYVFTHQKRFYAFTLLRSRQSCKVFALLRFYAFTQQQAAGADERRCQGSTLVILGSEGATHIRASCRFGQGPVSKKHAVFLLPKRQNYV